MTASGSGGNGSGGLADCPFCGKTVAVVEEGPFQWADGYPADAGIVVPNGRLFTNGAECLLHHDCDSIRASTNWRDGERWWDPDRAWWACQHPERHIDGDAYFELHCSDCAARWAESQSDET